MDKTRIDKWLWAARFFKTRTLAKEAVEGGKVHYEGHRVKPSKEVVVGTTLKIKQGWDDKVIVITAIADKRGNAKQAALLYEETPESIASREANTEKRQLARASTPQTQGKPNKKERRQLSKFSQQHE